MQANAKCLSLVRTMYLYTVYIWYFRQRIYQIYGAYTYTVLANLTNATQPNTHTYTHTHARAQTHTHTHTHARTHTRTHAHTLMHACLSFKQNPTHA